MRHPFNSSLTVARIPGTAAPHAVILCEFARPQVRSRSLSQLEDFWPQNCGNSAQRCANPVTPPLKIGVQHWVKKRFFTGHLLVSFMLRVKKIVLWP